MLENMKADLYRVLHSYRFLAAVMLIFLIWEINSRRFEVVQDVMYVFIYTKGLSITTLLAMVVTAFVFSGSYCEDHENHALRYLLMRSTLKRYVASKILVCAAAVIITYTMGSFLFVFERSLHLPLAAAESVAVQNFKGISCFGYLLPEHPLTFMGLQIVLDGVCCAVMGTLTLGISAVLPNIYLVMALPLVIYYFLYYLLGYLIHIPDVLHLESVFRSCATYSDNQVLFLTCAALTALVYLSGSGAFMYKMIRRGL